jgi:DNA modification methylase
MNVHAKSLCNIPHRFAIAMCDAGWILRNTLIWHKPNCMPSSIKDRYTVDFEYIFFFSKNERYYHQPQFSTAKGKSSGNTTKQKWQDEKGFQIRKGFSKVSHILWDKRLKRSVWKIASKPFPEAHFATYPEELCETPIKAGCPEAICQKCGKPRTLIIETSGGTIGKSWHDHSNDLVDGMTRIDYGSLASAGEEPYQRVCNVGFKPGIVLDPFMGAGTTALVALKLNRTFLGVELNQDYIDIANARIKPWLSQTTLKTID